MSIEPQVRSNKSPLLHVHSDLQCSQLLVTNELQSPVRSQQDSHPSSVHGHDRHRGALGSPVYRGYLPSVAPRAVRTRHPRTSWQRSRVNLARSRPNATRCSMLLDGILIAVFQAKTYWNARGLFGRHFDPKDLLLENSSNTPSLGPALFPTNCYSPHETVHWFFRANVSHESGDICHLRLSADRRPHYSAM